MLKLTGHIEPNELARRMWSKYLANDWKYDKFGAQGKVMLFQEVISEAGMTLQIGKDFQQMINEIFPRTFYCLHPRVIHTPLAKTILKYFRTLEHEFSQQGLPDNVTQHICETETSEKFCLKQSTVTELLLEDK